VALDGTVSSIAVKGNRLYGATTRRVAGPLAGGEGTNLLRGTAAGIPHSSVRGLDGRVGQFGPILGARSLRLEGQSASLTAGGTAANSWAPQHHPVPHPSRPEASGPPGRIGHPAPITAR